MKRIPFLDHARGLIIALVALQHAVQTYAQSWGGKMYFVVAPDRSPILDGVFFWTDSFIMQGLFFIAGLFVIPSLQRHGMLNFWKQKTHRIILPYIFALIFLVPMLSYVKFSQTIDPFMSFSDYVFEELLGPRFQQGGYWFLSYLMFMTACAVLIYSFLPELYNSLGQFVSWLFKRPLMAFLTVTLLVVLMISISDVIYGTPYWSRFLYIFVARSNMAASYFFFFVLGLGLRQSGLLEDQDWMERFAKSWKLWLAALVAISIPYTFYSVTYWEKGAITNDILIHFYQGGTWATAGPLLKYYLPYMLPRTIMHGILCILQIGTVLSVLMRFTNEKPAWFWSSLGSCSYGIYFFHEQLCVWMQYAMIDLHWPIAIKVLLALIAGLAGSWLLVAQGLRRIPILKSIF